MGIGNIFDKIKGARKDPALKGLDKFTPAQQERILNKIGAKEAELMDKKADRIVEDRVRRIEQRLGLSNQQQKGSNLASKLSSLKEYRQKNLARRESNLKRTQEIERKFKNGELKVKPVGQNAQQPRPELGSIKSVKLKAPPVGLR